MIHVDFSHEVDRFSQNNLGHSKKERIALIINLYYFNRIFVEDCL